MSKRKAGPTLSGPRELVVVVALVFCVAGTAQAQTVVYDVPLSGPQSVPPNTAPGMGTASMTLDTVTRDLSITGTYTNLVGVATEAHIHRGPPGTNGQIIVILTHTGGRNGTFSGAGTLNMGDLNAVLNGITYVDVHTDLVTHGEIRGQLLELDNLGCPAELPTDPVLTDCGGDPSLSPLLGSTTETLDFELDCSGAQAPGMYVIVFKLGKQPVPISTSFGTLWVAGMRAHRCPGVHNQDANKCYGAGGLVLPGDASLIGASYTVQGVCLDPVGGPRLSNSISQMLTL